MPKLVYDITLRPLYRMIGRAMAPRLGTAIGTAKHRRNPIPNSLGWSRSRENARRSGTVNERAHMTGSCMSSSVIWGGAGDEM